MMYSATMAITNTIQNQLIEKIRQYAVAKAGHRIVNENVLCGADVNLHRLGARF